MDRKRLKSVHGNMHKEPVVVDNLGKLRKALENGDKIGGYLWITMWKVWIFPRCAAVIIQRLFRVYTHMRGK